jgi:hypothetical protein
MQWKYCWLHKVIYLPQNHKPYISNSDAPCWQTVWHEDYFKLNMLNYWCKYSTEFMEFNISIMSPTFNQEKSGLLLFLRSICIWCAIFSSRQFTCKSCICTSHLSYLDTMWEREREREREKHLEQGSVEKMMEGKKPDLVNSLAVCSNN